MSTTYCGYYGSAGATGYQTYHGCVVAPPETADGSHKITINDCNGVPIAGVEVTLTSDDDGKLVLHTATTDTTGVVCVPATITGCVAIWRSKQGVRFDNPIKTVLCEPVADSSSPLTAAQIKTLYESNANTNELNDAEKQLLKRLSGGEIGEGIVGPQGEQGPAGQDGAAGPIGPIGPAGPQGDQGPIGLPGQDGQDGADGAVGPQGPAGQDGDQGPVGPMGLPGSVGPAGQDGVDGVDGPAGPQGEQGPVGPAGPAGSSLALFTELVSAGVATTIPASTPNVFFDPAAGQTTITAAAGTLVAQYYHLLVRGGSATRPVVTGWAGYPYDTDDDGLATLFTWIAVNGTLRPVPDPVIIEVTPWL